ncbi:zinc finger, CCHC-type containing protein [Tanacetum coccineum]
MVLCITTQVITVLNGVIHHPLGYLLSFRELPAKVNKARGAMIHWESIIEESTLKIWGLITLWGQLFEGVTTWVLTDLPPGCKSLGCKWIFKRKLKVDRTIEKFKARLVIQGFKQKSGIDYSDTYVPVARISTIRLLIAMALIHNLIIHHMDVKTTFWNGELDEEVYMNQPHGFIMPGNENKDMGEADVILGIRIKHKSNRIPIFQSHYIKKIVSQLEYSKVIGCLMYAMTCTRLDIAFVVGKLSRYTSNPGNQHWQAIQRTC